SVREGQPGARQRLAGPRIPIEPPGHQGDLPSVGRRRSVTPNAPERRPGVATRLLSALLLLIVAGETLYRAANSPAHRPLVWRLIRRLRPAVIDYRVGRQLVLRRSEEHTSELQSREHLVCRLLLEKK